MPRTYEPEQVDTARRRALEVREEQRDLFRAVRERRVSVAELLRHEPPAYLRNVHLHRLLILQPYFQDRRARQILEEAEAGLARTVGESTERQRRIIARQLDEWDRDHPVVAESVSA